MNMKRIKTAILLAGMAGSPWAMANILESSPTGGSGNVSFDYTLKTGACRVIAPVKQFTWPTLSRPPTYEEAGDYLKLGHHDFEFTLSHCRGVVVSLLLTVGPGKVGTTLPNQDWYGANYTASFAYPDGQEHSGANAPFFTVTESDPVNGTTKPNVQLLNMKPIPIAVNSDNFPVILRVEANVQTGSNTKLVNGTYTAGLTYTFSYQ
ncbi:hypothetical protein GC738_23240 [Salmonella enterica]|uniref:Fimbrial protein n=1 Tax=Salmonella enterica TaxID=28901 RepID=A0A633LEC2_SALER|nr:hypothetical protein [Salmonella enterica]